MIPKKIKISNYRPYAILDRNPEESTYAIGDDKFTPIADVRDGEFAEELVRRYNEYEALIEKIRNMKQL